MFNCLTLRKIIRKSRVKNSSSSNREVMDTSLIWNSCDILSRIRKKEKTSSWRRYDRCHHPVHPPFFFTSPPPAYHTRKDEDSPFYSYSESSIPSLTAAIQHDSSLDAFPTRVYRFRKSRDALQLPPLSFVSPCSCVLVKGEGRARSTGRIDVSAMRVSRNVFDSCLRFCLWFSFVEF